MQGFHRPALFDQSPCQIVQQRLVRRLFASQSEVGRRAYECRAEVLQPDAIDEHSSKQRVVSTGNPASEFQLSQVQANHWGTTSGNTSCQNSCRADFIRMHIPEESVSSSHR